MTSREKVSGVRNCLILCSTTDPRRMPSRTYICNGTDSVGIKYHEQVLGQLRLCATSSPGKASLLASNTVGVYRDCIKSIP